MAFDPSRLYSQLQNTGLQNSNNPLYQVVRDLISNTQSINTSTTTVSGIVSSLGDPVTPDHGGTGVSIPFTPGSIVFIGALGVYAQDNSKLFWDDTNFRLGIRTSSPLNAIDVIDTIAGPLGIRVKNLSTAGGNTHASLFVENSTGYGQLFKAGTGYVGYKNIAAGDLGFYNTGGNISILNDSGSINFDANGGASAQVEITSSLFTVRTLFFDNAFGGHQFAAAGTGFNTFLVSNATAGVGNGAQLVLGTDAINNFIIQAYSSTYTASGPAFPNGGALQNSGAGGLSFVQSGTGDIRFYTTGANVLRMTIATGGVISTTSSFRVDGALIGAFGVKQSGTAFAQGFALLTTSNDAFLELQYDGTVFKISSTYQTSEGYKPLALFTSETKQFQVETTGILTLTKTIGTYNGISTVSNGVPSEVAKIDTTGLTANVGAATLYVVPASGEGLYRVSAYVVETTAASLTSTLPNVQVVYTDKDSNTSVTLDVTPILGIAGIGQTGALNANTIGTVSSGVVPIYVKASTTIQYQTVNYASNIAGMAYALHIKLEAL